MHEKQGGLRQIVVVTLIGKAVDTCKQCSSCSYLLLQKPVGPASRHRLRWRWRRRRWETNLQIHNDPPVKQNA
jgi:hypothetical protein